jgi:hypothetical protein
MSLSEIPKQMEPHSFFHSGSFGASASSKIDWEPRTDAIATHIRLFEMLIQDPTVKYWMETTDYQHWQNIPTDLERVPTKDEIFYHRTLDLGKALRCAESGLHRSRRTARFALESASTSMEKIMQPRCRSGDPEDRKPSLTAPVSAISETQPYHTASENPSEIGMDGDRSVQVDTIGDYSSTRQSASQSPRSIWYDTTNFVTGGDPRRPRSCNTSDQVPSTALSLARSKSF